MMDDVRPEETSWPKLVFAGFLHRFWSITAVLTAIVLMALWYGAIPAVPRWGKLLTLSMVVAVPGGVIAGMKIVTWMPSPPKVWIVDADAKHVDGALFSMPKPAFDRFETLEHELEQWGDRLYCGTGVDLDAEVIEAGTWRGAAEDRELIAHLTQVYLVRDRLEPDARRWQRLRPQLPWLVRSEAAEETAKAFEAIEDMVLPGSSDETQFDRVESHLDDHLVDDDREKADDVDDDVPDVAGSDLGDLDVLAAELDADEDVEFSIDDLAPDQEADADD